MRRPEAAFVILAAAALAGCGDKGYVRTSFGDSPGFTRTSREVQASESDRKRQNAIGSHLLEAREHLQAGRFADARREAEAALRKDEGSIEAHTWLAVSLEGAGDHERAGRHYLRAAELAPGNGAALTNVGAWLCGRGRGAESLAWFDRAIALPGYGNRATALANAGVCAAKAGQPARADRDLRRAIELDPVNALALAALARREFAAGNLMAARAFSERRLAAAPADAEALLLASQIEQKLGDTAAAARYVELMKAELPKADRAGNSSTGGGGSP